MDTIDLTTAYGESPQARPPPRDKTFVDLSLSDNEQENGALRPNTECAVVNVSSSCAKRKRRRRRPTREKVCTFELDAFVAASSTSAAASADAGAAAGAAAAASSAVGVELSGLLTVFPDCDPAWLCARVDERRAQSVGEDSSALLNYLGGLLSEGKYQKIARAKLKDPMDVSEQAPAGLEKACKELLSSTFPWVPRRSIVSVMARHRGHFFPSAMEVAERLVAPSPNPSSSAAASSAAKQPLKLLAAPRPPSASPPSFGHEPWADALRAQVEAFRREDAAKRAAADTATRAQAAYASAEAEGTLIECACCYGDAAFETMVQCTEGHLFCADCLKRYAQEQLFGLNKTKLQCMDSGGCGGSFPYSMLQRSLPPKVLAKYEQAQARQSVKAAALDGLYTCPHCDTAALLPDGVRVFTCPNAECGKETCTLCHEPAHVPLRCEEVEKETATKARLSIEERMSEARIRVCVKPGCNTRFFKTEGCNKMTCPQCRTFMCYICRAHIPASTGYARECRRAPPAPRAPRSLPTA